VLYIGTIEAQTFLFNFNLSVGDAEHIFKSRVHLQVPSTLFAENQPKIKKLIYPFYSHFSRLPNNYNKTGLGHPTCTYYVIKGGGGNRYKKKHYKWYTYRV